MNQSDPDYVSTLLDILQGNYPALHQLIGDDYFAVMGCRYLKQYPPAPEMLAAFGDHLSGFLQTEIPYANVPSLAELADFETAMRQALAAADADIVMPDYLQSLSPQQWAELAFRFHPSLTIMKLEWNAAQIWAALSSGQNVADANIPEPERQPGFYLVYRKADRTGGWRHVAALEAAALESVYHGLNFAQLCAELCNLIDDVEAARLTAETFVRTWVEQGLFALR